MHGFCWHVIWNNTTFFSINDIEFSCSSLFILLFYIIIEFLHTNWTGTRERLTQKISCILKNFYRGKRVGWRPISNTELTLQVTRFANLNLWAFYLELNRMMNVRISIGIKVTDILPLVIEIGGETVFGKLRALTVDHCNREESAAHWLAPKVVSSAEVIT